MILQFDFNSYFKNPIVRYCYENNRNVLQSDICILTLDDCIDDIRKLRHSKWAFENKAMSFIGDELRLYYSQMYDDFLYVDADVLLNDVQEIKSHRNCTEKTKHVIYGNIINNGTFFHSDKDCKFNKFYFDLYESIDVYGMINYCVFNKYPFELSENTSGDMDLISPNVKHFCLSSFSRFKERHKDIDVIKYCTNKNQIENGCVNWVLEDNDSYISTDVFNNTEINYFDTRKIDKNDILPLFKEQMNYIYGKELQFIKN